jgi:vitamin B12 transporter
LTGLSSGPGTARPGANFACLAALAALVPRTAYADEPAAVGVEVRGETLAAPSREPSVAGSVIQEDRLRGPGLEAGDVLRTQPGVTVLETGGYGAPSTASIRGATGSQTPVYLAGVRINDDVGGTADLSLVPLWLLHRVEIYRSNAPLAGDQLGIGGAIFFDPRRPRGREVDAGTMAGSFGAHADWALAGAGDESASALVGVRFDAAKNDYTFVDDAGTRFEPGNFHTAVRTNADTRTVDAWAMGSVRLGAGPGALGRVDVVANDAEREAGLPGLTLFPSTRARVSHYRRLVGVTANVPCRDCSCDVTATTSLLSTGARYDDPLREVALNTTRLDIEATRVEEAVLARWWLTDRLSVTPSLRASVERMTTTALDVSEAHAQRSSGRAALQGQYALTGAWTLRALASAECDGTSIIGRPPWFLPGDASGAAQGSACDRLEPAARAGVEVALGPATLLANVGRYARVPTLTELYGISGAVRGNAALGPETGLSLEAGVRSSTSAASPLGQASVDLFGFVREAADLISYQRSSFGYIRPFNVGAARVAGLELLAAYRPLAPLLVEVAATVLDPRDTSPARPANDILPYQPRLTLAPRLELRSRLHAHPIDTGKLAIAYFYESSRYADRAGLIVIPDQGSLDVEGELGAWRGLLALRVRVANLLDQTRFDLIGYPLPGRAAYIALEAQW